MLSSLYGRASRGASKGHKVEGTIHSVSASHAVDTEVRLYDTLFAVSGYRRLRSSEARSYARAFISLGEGTILRDSRNGH